MPKFVGLAILAWGTQDEIWGYTESFEIEPEAETEKIKNGQGDTVGLVISDRKKKYSGEWTPLANQTNPPWEDAELIGKKLTLKTGAAATVDVHIESAALKYKKGGVATFSITAYNYPNIVDSGA